MRLLLLSVALIALVAGCLDPAPPSAPADDPAPGGATTAEPTVTIAHVDTGINPYHRFWRSNDTRHLEHPSTYLPGYPTDALPLNLTMDSTEYRIAVEADADVWSETQPGRLYYVPGTRIIGMINLDGTLTPDDHGHGTMTASRSASMFSLSPTAGFVSVQGLGANGVKWIADQAWIDVQTNSWGSLVPLPGGPMFDATPRTIEAAAARMPVIFASGNGNGFNGIGPNPTWSSQTAPAGTIQVGAHDNGHINLYHGQPAHVVADGYGGFHAEAFSVDAYGARGTACCTSAAAPYAAGGFAALILHARVIFNDTTPGITNGPGGERVLAEAADGVQAPETGPLADGVFTLEEAKGLFLKTAQVPVREGPHDGALHFGGRGDLPDPDEPGGNPYCTFCWATPLRWDEIPEDVPTVQHVGYGAIDPDSVALAKRILEGSEPMPQRPQEDTFFGVDAALRATLG